MIELTLHQGYHVATMLLVAGVSIALATFFYWHAFGMLGRWQWYSLLAMRIAQILLVVLLLFRPVFSYHKDLTEQPAVIFLFDRSSSMSIADDSTGQTRFVQGRDQIETWWDSMQGDFNLRLIEFAERARPLEDVSQLRTLAPDGKATSLSWALKTGVELLPIRDVEAVVLFSDGVHNSARNPLELVEKIPVPVHTIGIGASLKSDLSYRDIQVTGIHCPDRLMRNNKARITASVEGVGLAGRVIQVFLEEEGEGISEVELTLDAVEGAQQVAFEIRPTVKGRRTYTVRIPPIDEEKIGQNNQRSAIALVVEPGIRVLYLEGTLRAEYGAIVDRFLAKDPDLEFCALVQTRPNRFLKRTNIEGLELTSIPTDAATINTFDVFVLGDLDASYLRGESQKLILERIRNGGGLIMLGGYHSLGPGGYKGTPLGDALPVLLGDRSVGQINDVFLPVLTPEGVRNPIFANIANFFPSQTGQASQEGLPPLDGCTRILSTRPTATVLATCPVDANSMPVLATQPVGKGRTVVFCGDTTRKWHQGPRALDLESPFLRFWGQMVRYLAGRSSEVEAKASITASTDKGHYEPDEPFRISAVVRDEQGEGAKDVKVEATIRPPQGKPDIATLSTVPGPSGHYSVTYEPTVSGEHEVVVSTRLGELTLESENLIVEVGRPNLEFENLDLDGKMLAQIASDTGGRYLHIASADLLIDQLDRTIRQRREYFERRLFSGPLFWVLFVGLLTAEWIMRRRFQLR